MSLTATVSSSPWKIPTSFLIGFITQINSYIRVPMLSISNSPSTAKGKKKKGERDVVTYPPTTLVILGCALAFSATNRNYTRGIQGLFLSSKPCTCDARAPSSNPPAGPRALALGLKPTQQDICKCAPCANSALSGGRHRHLDLAAPIPEHGPRNLPPRFGEKSCDNVIV